MSVDFSTSFDARSLDGNEKVGEPHLILKNMPRNLYHQLHGLLEEYSILQPCKINPLSISLQVISVSARHPLSWISTQEVPTVLLKETKAPPPDPILRFNT